MVNTEKFKEVLTRLEDEDGTRARRRDFAEAVNVLARSSRAATIVEIGSSEGYITIWLALAAESNGGQLHFYDNDNSRLEKVKELLTEIEFDRVIYHNEVPSESSDMPSDIGFLVLDHDLDQHLHYFQTCFPYVNEGGTIISDNAIAGFADLRGYINEVRMGEHTSSVMFPLGEGLEVTTKSKKDDPLNLLYTDLIR